MFETAVSEKVISVNPTIALSKGCQRSIGETISADQVRARAIDRLRFESPRCAHIRDSPPVVEQTRHPASKTFLGSTSAVKRTAYRAGANDAPLYLRYASKLKAGIETGRRPGTFAPAWLDAAKQKRIRLPAGSHTLATSRTDLAEVTIDTDRGTRGLRVFDAQGKEHFSIENILFNSWEQLRVDRRKAGS
jgi:hypothetical protein